MSFIKLTGIDGTALYVNPSHIASFYQLPEKQDSVVFINDNIESGMQVRQTPDDIVCLCLMLTS